MIIVHLFLVLILNAITELSLKSFRSSSSCKFVVTWMYLSSSCYLMIICQQSQQVYMVFYFMGVIVSKTDFRMLYHSIDQQGVIMNGIASHS